MLERASARETAARVAAGSVARAFLAAVGVSVHSHVIRIGSVTAPDREDLDPSDFKGVDDDPVRCLDPEASAAMVERRAPAQEDPLAVRGAGRRGCCI